VKPRMITTSETGAEERWYAVRTKPRHEKVVARLLEIKGYEQLLPQYTTRKKWADRVKEITLPLFPGYVFCRFDARCRVPVLNTPGVVDIVRVAKEPAPVNEEEIKALKRVIGAGLTCIPLPNIESGERVKIGFGPLAGVVGTIIEVKNNRRLVLSVSLLNRFVLVEVDGEMLALDDPPRPGLPKKSPGMAWPERCAWQC
jgi:transcriptional antiterminator NusG